MQLVIADAHTGLTQASSAVMAGAAWPRCRVHSCVTCWPGAQGSAEMVAAAIRTSVAQPTGLEVIEQVDKVAATLKPRFPTVARMLADANRGPDRLGILPTRPLGQALEHHPWSGATRSSSAGPTWSGASPMTPPCSDSPGRC